MFRRKKEITDSNEQPYITQLEEKVPDGVIPPLGTIVVVFGQLRFDNETMTATVDIVIEHSKQVLQGFPSFTAMIEWMEQSQGYKVIGFTQTMRPDDNHADYTCVFRKSVS